MSRVFHLLKCIVWKIYGILDLSVFKSYALLFVGMNNNEIILKNQTQSEASDNIVEKTKSRCKTELNFKFFDKMQGN